MNWTLDHLTSFFTAAAERIGSIGLFADGSPDGRFGLVIPGLAGVTAALAVAMLLTVYFRIRYRSTRDMIRHGLTAAAVLGLLAFVAYDMRHAAFAYLGISAAKPEVEFEIKLPKAAAITLADRGPNHAFAIPYRVL